MSRIPNLRSRIDAWRDRPRSHDPRSAETPKLSFALLWMALVMAGGTLGFVETEEGGPWRAFYFTFTTATTVGYGDEGISEDGKKFASLLLMGGVLSASYAFGMIVRTSVARQLAWKKRMQKRISRLHGHTIVCGFGRMGQPVCKKLVTRGTHFVVIDQDPLHVSRALDLGYLVIEGNACEAERLIHTGIARAGHIVAAVDNVAEDIVITMESRELAPKAYIIARAERDEDVRNSNAPE